MYVLLEFNNLESISTVCRFPSSVDAMKRYEEQGLKYITEFVGPIPGHNSMNALVAQNFHWNPDQSPEEFLATVSARQFRETAGKLMFRAWEEIREAMNVWNDHAFVRCRKPDRTEHWNADRHSCSILPDIVKSFTHDLEIRTNVEPWRAADYQKFKEKAFLDKMKRMNVHLARAAEHAETAIAAASDKEFIGICYYEGVSGRPTCKEYAELNYAPIAIADALCRQRCDLLRAYHLLTEIESARAAGDEKSAREKEKLYHELIREDIGVQEVFANSSWASRRCGRVTRARA